MQSAVIQISKAYDSGMSPEQIAEDQQLDVVVVKSALMSHSSKYRKACGQEDEDEDKLNFTKDQLRTVNDMIYSLAIGSDDEHVRTKNCQYIRDDFKGRKEPVKQLANNNTFNILQWNEQIAAAREIKKRMLVDV